ncbi:hypothetical protein RhiJN_22013 [Ceratobasidium sp. AG-Ba]|nr:hypothetical protein RhiJN_22013 [Ceratobasidium sp. AG-Ba]
MYCTPTTAPAAPDPAPNPMPSTYLLEMAASSPLCRSCPRSASTPIPATAPKMILLVYFWRKTPLANSAHRSQNQPCSKTPSSIDPSIVIDHVHAATMSIQPPGTHAALLF